MKSLKKSSRPKIKTYRIWTVGDCITRKWWRAPSYLKYYKYMDSDGFFKNALNSKKGLIEWVGSKYDEGEAAKFLCEILKADSLEKTLDVLKVMPEETIKEDVLPILVKKFKAPLDWRKYYDTELIDFSPYATAASELNEEIPSDLLEALGIDIDDSEYYAQTSKMMDVDEANKILESRGINIRFK